MTIKNSNKQRFQLEYLKLKRRAREYYKYVKNNKLSSCEVEDIGKTESSNHASKILGYDVFEK